MMAQLLRHCNKLVLAAVRAPTPPTMTVSLAKPGLSVPSLARAFAAPAAKAKTAPAAKGKTTPAAKGKAAPAAKGKSAAAGKGKSAPAAKGKTASAAKGKTAAAGKGKATSAGKKDCKSNRPTVGCACARHPWPEEDEECKEEEEKPKDCDFDFKKLEVNPFDPPCDCQDPPPAAGCADVGKPKEVCCRSIRQYGCCEEEEESCEEEEEDVKMEEKKTCNLDFKKLEVNPYDDPCECHDPPPAASCAEIPRKDICCRTLKPFSCMCEAYDEPGLECFKEKAPAQKKKKKECKGKEWKGKCL